MVRGSIQGLPLWSSLLQAHRLHAPGWCAARDTHESVEEDDEWNADDAIDALLEQDEDFIDNNASPIRSDAAGKRRCARFESRV